MNDKKNLSKSYQFDNVEEKWLQRWNEAGSFRAEMEEGKQSFSVVIPPPNVTGVLHVGHALNNTMQDVLVRYHRMCGDNTLWVPGTDHAGIATQNVVERAIAREGKTRFDLGREAFLERVWAWKKQYGHRILEQLKRLGISPDWDRLVFTMDPAYSRAVRKAFVELYRRGWIYRGFRLIHWCPRCGTALADDEVEYEHRDGKLYTLRYPLADGEGYVDVATTRPETYLGDTAVAVHPGDARYRSLVGRKVRLPLIDWERTTPEGTPVPPEIPIIADERVDPEYGTGAVKVTPAHDFNDWEMGEEHGLPRVQVLDEKARTTTNAGPFAGLDRLEARQKVLDALRKAGYVIKEEPIEHNVGVCYRCKTVVEPMLSLQWFVRMKDMAQDALRAVEEGEIRLIPPNFVKLYRHWLENVRDWCISRQIWWGHRIPAYYCQDCGHINVSEDPPTRCAQCSGRNLVQDEDVLDTWFSSWLWPFATLGWPEQTSELAVFYPTTLLITGWDILFFWVARMIMAGYAFMKKPPFRYVYLHGLVRDEKRRKISKSLGNFKDPLELFETYSVDGVRAGMALIAPEGQDVLFSEKRIELGRNFANKVWNASRFLLMNLPEGMEPADLSRTELRLEDRWMITRWNLAIQEITKDLESFDYVHAVKGMFHLFWNEFCDWYLEAIKPRLRQGGEDARVARTVALTLLEHLLRMLHPLMPFVTEELWQRLPAWARPDRPSIMVAPWPETLPGEDDAALEAFQFLKEWVTAVREIRSTFKIPKQETVQVLLKLPEGEPRRDLLEAHVDLWAPLAFGATFGTTEEVPPASATGVVRGVPFYVPLAGVIDLARERARLQREYEALSQRIQGFQKRLTNESFLRSAPTHVVEQQRKTYQELQEKARHLRQMLDQMEDGA
ncbi:MAG: valine--tRNA ligase [Candidatus Hydrothermae bacterium]|nr:valine--tRNA ligase [Candidatus Hydrothermae bacterium]